MGSLTQRRLAEAPVVTPTMSAETSRTEEARLQRTQCARGNNIRNDEHNEVNRNSRAIAYHGGVG